MQKNKTFNNNIDFAPSLLGGGTRKKQTISKEQLMPYASAIPNFDTFSGEQFQLIKYTHYDEAKSLLQMDKNRFNCHVPLHILCQCLSLSDIKKLALLHLARSLPSRLNREQCINELQGHYCGICDTHSAIFAPDILSQAKGEKKRKYALHKYKKDKDILYKHDSEKKIKDYENSKNNPIASPPARGLYCPPLIPAGIRRNPGNSRNSGGINFGRGACQID